MKHKNFFLTIAILAITASLPAPQTVLGQENKNPALSRVEGASITGDRIEETNEKPPVRAAFLPKPSTSAIGLACQVIPV